MRVDLKGFQEEAVGELVEELAAARKAASARPQVITFSAPTGSGKTVMAGALIEATLIGGDLAALAGVEPEPATTFLWLSDSPELNEQSRRRLLQATEGISADRMVAIENTFDQPTFDPGKVYFLNYGKLRTDALLTRPGDRRATTIWETIAQTGRSRLGGLVVLMDEAHKGVGTSAADQERQRTLAAAFIMGGGTTARIRVPGGTEPFPPVDLLVGISATPQRFRQLLIGGPARKHRSVEVPAPAVGNSGIIKDRLVLHGLRAEEQQPFTLLAEAVRRVQQMDGAWRTYTTAQGKPPVIPLLVVQVEDAAGGQPSATSLDAVAEVLGREWPDLTEDAVVHCFGDHEPLRLANGWTLRRRDPNDLAGEATIRVVLFKTALNTGWDCPRAEVLMSFRRSSDATVIAQLVGRMLRTPLAERVEGDETLNDAHLYLPFFDRERLQAVKEAISSDEGAVANVQAAEETVSLVPRAGSERLLAALVGLPHEVVGEGKALPDLRRVTILARYLAQDGIVEDAVEQTSEALVAGLLESLHAAEAADEGFRARVTGRRNVTLSSFELEDGLLRPRTAPETAEVQDRDIENAFAAAGAALGGEVGATWCRARFPGHVEDLATARLEFLELSGRPAVLGMLQRRATALFNDMRQKNVAAIAALPTARLSAYGSIDRAGRAAQFATFYPPDRIIAPAMPDKPSAPGHLYVVEGTEDEYRADFNSWELAVLAEERVSPRFLGFLRNQDSARWALSFAYDLNGTLPGFPDFLVLRDDGAGGVVVDILEPHHAADNVAKAQGLARFAATHGAHYGRIQMIRPMEGLYRRLSFDNEAVRRRILNEVKGEGAS